jgi:hypothetical protein
MIINKLTEDKLMDMQPNTRTTFALSGLGFAMDAVRLDENPPREAWFAVRVTANNKAFTWQLIDGTEHVIHFFGEQAGIAIARDHGSNLYKH